jgi:hypothetical protein
MRGPYVLCLENGLGPHSPGSEDFGGVFHKIKECQKIGRFNASRPLKNDGIRRIFVLSSKEF